MKARKLSGITLPGAGYPQLNDFLYVPPPVLPVTAGLVGLYTAGYSDAMTLRNYANAAKPLTKFGAPVVTAGAIGAATSRPNHYDTGLLGTADLTLLVVCKLVKPANVGAGWLGLSSYNIQQSNNASDSLGFGFIAGPTAQMAAAQTSSTFPTQSTLTTAGTAGDYNVMVGRVRNDGSTQVWWSHGGVVATSGQSAAATRYVQPVATLRIGGHMKSDSSNFAATNTVLCAAVVQAAWSDADIAANLAYLSTTWGPSLGIPTL